MARKRLTVPAAPGGSSPALPEARPAALGPGLAPAPISRVTGEAAATAALREVAGELAAARTEGRLVLRIDLDRVDEGWLVRDRLGIDDEELDSLMASLSAHGQRTPIEVAETGGGRYGLISGWRRVTALRRLRDRTGEERFGTVLALLRRPDSAAEAYVAMVEENEIRLGLSYYERARIAARAVEAGVFESEKAALQRLYASASRARRSKIGSFLTIYHALEGVLRFPAALPERLGLALAQAIEAGADLIPRLRADLGAAAPASAEAEQALLASRLAGAGRPPRPARPRPEAAEVRPGLFLRGARRGELVLYGPAVDAGFRERLRDWLAGQG